MKAQDRSFSPAQAAQLLRRLLPITLDDFATIKEQFPGLRFTITLADPDERPRGRLILTIEEKDADERATD